jgi:hypothetical protein
LRLKNLTAKYAKISQGAQINKNLILKPTTSVAQINKKPNLKTINLSSKGIIPPPTSLPH